MQEPRTHAQRAVSSPGEEPVASLPVYPAGMDQPGQQLNTQENERSGGPQAQAGIAQRALIVA